MACTSAGGADTHDLAAGIDVVGVAVVAAQGTQDGHVADRAGGNLEPHGRLTGFEWCVPEATDQ
jgi:hypothetical protein